MYLKHMAIKNIGPISELNIELPFNDDGNPKPIIFVGENGAGKTIMLSQIIDSFYEIGGAAFNDIKVSQGMGHKYYKVSGAVNIQIGKDKGFSALQFLDSTNKIEYLDKVGEIADEPKTYISNFTLTSMTKENEKKVTSLNDENKKDLESNWLNGVYFYQPAYRYEEPFWKVDEFRHDERFMDSTRYRGELRKEIEIISSNNENKQFVLDLILDYILSQNSIQSLIGSNAEESLKDPNILLQVQTKVFDITLWTNINEILRKVKDNEHIEFQIGQRGKNRVSILDKETNTLLPISNLSLGESVLLNLFINIVRHACQYNSKSLNEIVGIVAIDEIDIHLHTNLQSKVLPQLIKLFPKVQFIITSHSPLFLLGMEREFGVDGVEIRNMPNGELITTERFVEFENAYKVLKETERYENEIKEQIKNSTKPLVFVEGDYDIKYIKKAAELFDKKDLIEKVKFIDADGYQNLNKIWKHNTNLLQAIPQEMLLLYDCDTKVENKTNDRVFKRIIPYMKENYFDRGIENLFSESTIEKVMKVEKTYIDVTDEIKKTVRGKEIVESKRYDINPDEKGNLCTWLCTNGDKDDFKNFDKVFKIFEEFLKEENSE
ncbi:hypothetical protein YH65_04395 [Sulfurovum lithotrophicum]|uniref:Endonuclease GajA/Old nuclease/RecF-like AAA domain-containing protein n=1 Tax=Sulfurovum lithotrophicum TaxID=206403 RepID=A0A7U4M0Q9_9BACT|nr:AAA family ATPase [Sulfurovum lithotrophicum]AKF24709.1 hypothetical protein YH65_04395 [Sulfurovum lithotrophicum]